MAASLEQADAMVAAVERYGVAFNMGTNRRWETPYDTMKELIGGGRYGRLLSMTIHQGAGLFNMGSHAFDRPSRRWRGWHRPRVLASRSASSRNRTTRSDLRTVGRSPQRRGSCGCSCTGFAASVLFRLPAAALGAGEGRSPVQAAVIGPIHWRWWSRSQADVNPRLTAWRPLYRSVQLAPRLAPRLAVARQTPRVRYCATPLAPAKPSSRIHP